MITSGFYIDCQSCQPVHVFINGKFMFTFNLREPNNKTHGYSNYGIDTDEMDQFEINGSKGYEQKTGDDKVFRRWMALATLLADAPTSESLYAQICDIVDIDEYCNYMAAECYIGCTDWLTNCNNAKGYRSRADGKFHLITMDLDQGFSSSNMISSLAGSLYDSRYETGRSYLIDIFLNMLRHEPFRKRFIDAFCLVDGSVFETNRSTAIIMGLWEEKMKAAEFENQTSALDNSASWLISAISSRGSRMNNFRNYFGLTNPVTIELSSNVDGANILANGQEIPTGKFAGTLHTPMVLTAQAPAGYRFTGWQQTGGNAVVKSRKLFGTTSTWDYFDQGSLDGQQWNEEGYSTSAWSNGNSPFGYGNVGIGGESDYQTTLDYGDDPNNKRLTYYFRKTIQLTSKPGDKDVYVLTGYIDDGCVVYVNGHEVGRYLMPEGEIHYADFSTAYAGNVAGMCTFTLDNKWLHSGTNVIAVEVHNTHEHSSDIYWTAELVHNTLGDVSLLSAEPVLDLAAYEGQTLGHVVATYEAVAEDESLAALALPIRVNEVSAGNSVFINDLFKKNDWIELYNTTDTELDVAGLYLSDKLDNPMKYQIPSSATVSTHIPAHGHLIVWADQLEAVSQLHAPFKLSNKDGGMVLLVSSDEFVQRNAAFFEAHPSLRQFADGLTYNAHGGDQSAGRYPDGGNDIYIYTRPTIGKPNSRCTEDAFIGTDEGILDEINEVLTPVIAQDWDQEPNPFADTSATSEVVACYTLSGTYLGREPEHLSPGIYLVRMSDGTTRKIWKKY